MNPSAEIVVGRQLRAAPFRVREITYPPDHAQPTHAHPLASVTLVLEGSLRERVGAEEEEAGTLGVVTKPAGVEHADVFGPEGAHTLQVVFDAGEALGERRGRLLPPWHWRHGGPAVRPLLRLWRGLRRDAPGLPTELEDRVLSAVAALGDEAPSTADPPGWLAMAREALDEALPRHVPVRRLADLAGVHPVSLSRAFRRQYGCTITAYRRRERLRRAAGRLRETGRQVARIAHAAGYADHAHLCRDFRDATGMTPTEFRRLAGGA